MRLPSHPHALRRALSLALLLSTAAACSDAPTASRTAPAPRHDGATAVRTLRPPTLVPNRIKYRDVGHKPATGRAGSASLYLQALTGRDGKTDLQVSTDQWGLLYGWGPGEIAQLQVKALDPAGKLLATHTHTDLPDGGAVTLTYGGMARGTRLRVQGTVRGIDANRTDVPVVTGTVRLRPNLAVQGVLAPPRVRAGKSVPISATVAETNGDVGAWSTCTLYVDGMQQDWARGIWVDAGDAVTCLFSASFASEGKHRVEVRLGDASPRDDDPDDNTASAEVEVYTTDELLYSASVYQLEMNDRWLTRSRWTVVDSTGSDYGDETENETRTSSTQSSVTFYGWTVRAMSQIPRVEVEEESAGIPLHAAAYELEELVWYGSQRCGQGIDGTTGVFIFACTDPELGGTNVSYNHWTTHVTYHSSAYSRVWDNRTGEEQVYHSNYDSVDEGGPAFQRWGSDFTIRLRLVADGTQFWAASTFPLQTWESPFVWPLSCWTNSYPWIGATSEYCYQYESFSRSTSGSGYN